MSRFALLGKAKVLLPALIWVKSHLVDAAPSSIPLDVSLKVEMHLPRMLGGQRPVSSMFSETICSPPARTS